MCYIKIMFKKIFGSKDENKSSMSHEEALKFLMDNMDDELGCKPDMEILSTGNELEDSANSIVVAEKEFSNFNDAGEMVSILNAMRLKAEKLVDPKDIEKIAYNKKIREAVAVLTKSQRPEIAVYSIAIGAKISLIILFCIAGTEAFQKNDILTKIRIAEGMIGGGAIAGLVFSETGYRKRKEKSILEGQLADLFSTRNGVAKNLELPESLASEVQQHIEYVEYEEVFGKLGGSHEN